MTAISVAALKHYQKPQRHLAWFMVSLMSGYQWTWAHETTDEPPQKQIVLIKVKDIPCSFSVERHSSHLMLTLSASLPPLLPPLPPLSLSLFACLVMEMMVKAVKTKGWANIDTDSLCERGYTNRCVIQSWNSSEWINWTLKGLTCRGLRGQTMGHRARAWFLHGFFFGNR